VREGKKERGGRDGERGEEGVMEKERKKVGWRKRGRRGDGEREEAGMEKERKKG